MLVGGGVAVAADLYRAIFRVLEECGNDPDELASEFTRLYSEIEQTYAWKDDVRLQQWMRMALAKSVHTRLVHSRGDLCLFLCGDVLDRRGDGRLIVEL